jgi:hypothetical protein
MTLDLANWTELIATITCTVCLLYKPSVTNRWFIWFLWLTIFVELTGKLTTKMLLLHYSVYNIFNAVEFLIYIFFLFRLTKSRGKQAVIKWLALIFLLFFLCNLCFGQGVKIYNHQTVVLSSAILIIFCLLQYSEIINSDNPRYSKWSVLFIISGIFIFYTGTFRIFISFNYIVNNLPKEITWVYKLIVSNLNVILYSLLSLGFVFDALEVSKTKKEISKENTTKSTI